MNVALPALVIFILLLPGFIVRSRIKRAERTSLDYSPFSQVVTEAVLCACICHFVWIVSANVLFGRTVEVAVLMKLLSADAPGQAKAADTVATYANWIALYFGTLFFSTYILPAIARAVITRSRLDRYNARFSSLFRFHKAPWYYLLTGADFEKDNQPGLISISAIVNVAGEPFLYSGYLEEYFLNSDGELDRLVLQQVMRRPLAKDKTSQTAFDRSRFYEVDGDYFVLRYSEAITLNVEYIELCELPITTETATETPQESSERGMISHEHKDESLSA